MSSGVNGKKPTSIPNGVFDSVYKSEVGSTNGVTSVPFDEPLQQFGSGEKTANEKSVPSGNPELANMLRECANYVEKGEFNPIIYQILGALHVYTGEKTNAPPRSNIMPTHDEKETFPDESSVSSSRQSKLSWNRRDSTKVLASNLGNLGKNAKNMWSKHTKNENIKRHQPKEESSGNSLSSTTDEQQQQQQMPHISTTGDDPPTSIDTPTSTNNNKSTTPKSHPSTPKSKPAFQRPINPNSNLIANGWIEQQRRSKMRVAWKEVLASLVSARKAGEETTLWIQRQVMSPAHRAELEALHQVPMKWLEDISYVEINGEHRFVLKVFNITEEFQFRTADYESAQNWIMTLRSARGSSVPAPSALPLGSIGAMGGGEGDVGNVRPMRASGGNRREEMASSTPTRQRHTVRSITPNRQRVPPENLSIKELKAVAREANIDTFGMERADLEKIAAKHYKPRSSPTKQIPPPPPPPAPQSSSSMGEKASRESNLKDVDARRAAEFAAADKRRQEQEEAAARGRLKQQQEEAAARGRLKQQQEEAAARGRLKQQQEVAEKERQRQHEEMERIRLSKERAEEDRRRQQQQEHVARQQQEQAERVRQQQEQVAAQERLRQQQEQAAAQERLRQHQEQAAAQERLRQQQEQAAALERLRQQQEAQQRIRQQQEQAATQERIRQQQEQQWRQQQQWQKQQWQKSQPQYFNHQQQQQQQHAHPPHQHPPQPQQPFYPNMNASAPPPPQQQPQHQQQQQQSNPQGANPSQFSSKYAKAMNEEDSGQAAITALKRNILINWALQPPTLNSLRPIHHLVCSIHRVFPPSFNVSGHEYFKKWKSISANDLQVSSVMNNAPDEEKLKKAVRKIRFFLHPDKLPKDLDEQQQFMCKMLWDVTSDAWEEHKTKSEELDWVSP